MKEATKKVIKYDETNVPGGYCMTGREWTKKEKEEVSEFIDKIKKGSKTKTILQKIF
jgi:hypothetical protein